MDWVFCICTQSWAISRNWLAPRGKVLPESAKSQMSNHQNTENTRHGYYSTLGLMIRKTLSIRLAVSLFTNLPSDSGARYSVRFTVLGFTCLCSTQYKDQWVYSTDLNFSLFQNLATLSIDIKYMSIHYLKKLPLKTLNIHEDFT